LQVEELARTHALQVEELVNACVLHAGIAQPPLGMTPRTTHIHSIYPTKVSNSIKNQILWCNAHYVQVGARKAELAALQLVHPIGTKSTVKSPTNQEARAPLVPGFPYTMLSVERVKDNMQLAFIEKFFTNHTIKTNVQTKYLRFKGVI